MSPSPPPRDQSPSPEPASHAGPSKQRPRNTVIDLQRRQIEKLLANPDKEVQLPTGTQERTLRAPREMMKNVQGSSAGAGSGEFHVYKQSRRREYERLKIMDDKAKAEEEHAAFLARQAERDSAADAKTSKNRAKRQKRKQGRKGGSAIEGSGAGANGGAGAGGVVKRKLEGGAKVVFKRPGEEGSDSEGGEEEVGPAVPVTVPLPVVNEEQKVTQESTISIVDED
ncbi:hypothetical protein IAT38_001373 [Cryptococcus sp. DSM 104549]